MKRWFVLFGLLAASLLLASSAPLTGCRCKGIPLYGRVRVVDHHADFLVRVVEHHADLHVKKVSSHPDRCGLWQFVDSHPDFTVRFVDSHEDFSIRFVDHHPGRP